MYLKRPAGRAVWFTLLISQTGAVQKTVHETRTERSIRKAFSGSGFTFFHENAPESSANSDKQSDQSGRMAETFGFSGKIK